MRAWPLMLAPLLALDHAPAHAQARGPSVREIQENGMYIMSEQDKDRLIQEQYILEQAQDLEAVRDPAVRAQRLADLDAWLRRLPGRYRVEGAVENPRSSNGAVVPIEMDLHGVADCTQVGDGPGVQCVINASFSIIQKVPTGRTELRPLINPRRPTSRLPTKEERLDVMRPAMLMFGLNLDPPGINALLVTADSLAHSFVGKLEGETGRVVRTNQCDFLNCLYYMMITPEPDNEVVTIRIMSGVMTYYVNLVLVRDPDAQLEKELRRIRAR